MKKWFVFIAGKELDSTNRNTHVDHFIPWSYIQNDNLWNLVLSCQACNGKKSDKLASGKYLHKLLPRNEVLFNRVSNEHMIYY